MMAYLTFIAAVPEAQIGAIRSDAACVLKPTLIKGVSHLLSYWIQVQPLGQALNSVIDGGQCLNEAFWHPLRSPRVHLPQEVVQLTGSLYTAWSDLSERPEYKDDWLTSEMARLLEVLFCAAETGACIVTALDLPGDHERAKRVRIPWLPPTAEHGSPGRSWWPLW
jgi:hypothetical protein